MLGVKYIVRFRPGYFRPEVAASCGFNVKNQHENIRSASVACNCPDSEQHCNHGDTLKARPEVESVDLNVQARAFFDIRTYPFAYQGQAIPWGVGRVNALRSTRTTTNLTDVELFILDTGKPEHTDINVVEGVNKLEAIRPPLPNETVVEDLNGHGTHVAGLAGAVFNTFGIFGITPNVKIHAVKVLDQNGDGFLSELLAGLSHVLTFITNNPTLKTVTNLSLGFSAPYGAVPTLDSAISDIVTAGGTVVAAAGNNAVSVDDVSPASHPDVISVEANDTEDRLATFSNFGAEVSAPGVDLLSTYLGNALAYLSGTSMACPIVAGICASILDLGEAATPAAVKTFLLQNAVTLKDGRKMATMNWIA